MKTQMKTLFQRLWAMLTTKPDPYTFNNEQEDT